MYINYCKFVAGYFHAFRAVLSNCGPMGKSTFFVNFSKSWAPFCFFFQHWPHRQQQVVLLVWRYHQRTVPHWCHPDKRLYLLERIKPSPIKSDNLLSLIFTLVPSLALFIRLNWNCWYFSQLVRIVVAQHLVCKSQSVDDRCHHSINERWRVVDRIHSVPTAVAVTTTVFEETSRLDRFIPLNLVFG